MSTAISLTPAEQKQLRLQARRSIGRVSERIHYILLFSRGHTAEQIASLYEVDERTVQDWEVDERTVQDWLERFRQHGAAGLDDRPRSGRPRLATVAAHVEATRALEATPQEAGAEQTLWTRRLLQRHLTERVDCPLSLSTVTRLIHRTGFVWRRPKLVLKQTDPQKAEREAAILQALAEYPAARLWQSIPPPRACLWTSAICTSFRWCAAIGSAGANRKRWQRRATTASRRSLAF